MIVVRSPSLPRLPSSSSTSNSSRKSRNNVYQASTKKTPTSPRARPPVRSRSINSLRSLSPSKMNGYARSPQRNGKQPIQLKSRGSE